MYISFYLVYLNMGEKICGEDMFVRRVDSRGQLRFIIRIILQACALLV